MYTRRRRVWATRILIAGVIAAALVSALWMVSKFQPVRRVTTRNYLGLDRGRLFVATTDAPADPRLLAAIVDGVRTSGHLGTRWLPRSGRGWGSNAGSNGRFFYTLVAVPILPIAGVVAAVTGLAFGLIYRRTPRGACAECGYDLRGVPGGRCPECGVESIVTRLVRWAMGHRVTRA